MRAEETQSDCMTQDRTGERRPSRSGSLHLTSISFSLPELLTGMLSMIPSSGILSRFEQAIRRERLVGELGCIRIRGETMRS